MKIQVGKNEGEWSESEKSEHVMRYPSSTFVYKIRKIYI